MNKDTDCNKCVFRKMKKGYQTGCVAQDISMFDIDTSNQSYVIHNKICQYKRTTLGDAQNVEDCLKLTRKQIEYNYCLFTQIDKPEEAIDLYNSVYSNRETNIPKQLYAIVGAYEGINHDVALAVKNRENLTVCVVDPGQLDNIPGLVMSQKTNSNHHVFLDKQLCRDVHISFFEWLDIQINDNGFRYKVLYGKNAFIIPTIVYRTTEMRADVILDMAEKDRQCMSFKDLYDKFVNFCDWDNYQKRCV